jgi:hypothetical protein
MESDFTHDIGGSKVSDGYLHNSKKSGLILVGTARFELATPCTPSKCATRLRYVPMEYAAERATKRFDS